MNERFIKFVVIFHLVMYCSICIVVLVIKPFSSEYKHACKGVLSYLGKIIGLLVSYFINMSFKVTI